MNSPVDQDWLELIFTAAALSGAASSNHPPEHTAQNAVTIGRIAAMKFSQPAPATVKAPVMSAVGAAVGDDFAAKMRAAALSQNIKGIPGDGTFPKDGQPVTGG